MTDTFVFDMATTCYAHRDPVSNAKVYRPLVPFADPQTNKHDPRCPLWMCWLAAGMGGSMLLNDNVLAR